MQFVHVKKLQFKVSTITTIDSIAKICHLIVCIWLIKVLKGYPLWKLFIFGNLAKLIRVTTFAPFFNFSTGTLKFIRFVYSFAESFSVEFCMVALVGYLTKKLPKGMEATGIVVILSSISLAFGISNSFGVNQLNSYKVKDGYYDRGAEMLLFGYTLTLLMNLVSPLFLLSRNSG